MLQSLIKLIAGAGLAQGIALVAAPVLSRIYTPLDFGLFGIFMAFLSVLGNVSTLRFEIAIPLPKSSSRARDLVVASLLIAAAFSILVGAVSLSFGQALFSELVPAQYVELFAWLPVSMLGFALYQAATGWMARRSEINSLAISQNARATAVALTQVTAGLLGFGAIGLVVGHAIGQMSAALLTMKFARPSIGRLELSRTAAERVWSTAQEYSTFPKHGALQALLNSISQTLLTLLLGVLFGPAVAGFYVLAQRAVLAPIQVVASAFRQVLTPRFARLASRQSTLSRIYVQNVTMLALLGLPAVAALALLGPKIFVLVFGAGWADAGTYASVLVFSLWGDLMLPPATIVLVVLRQQRIQLAFEVAMLAARLCAIFVGFQLDSALWSVVFFSAVGLLMNVALILLAYRLVKQFDVGVGELESSPRGGAVRKVPSNGQR